MGETNTKRRKGHCRLSFFHFALRSRRFCEIVVKNGVQIRTRQFFLLIALTSIIGPQIAQFHVYSSFTVKLAQKTPSHNMGMFSMFQCFVFFFIFAFLALVFSSLPLLLDILKPKRGPLNEVIG